MQNFQFNIELSRIDILFIIHVKLINILFFKFGFIRPRHLRKEPDMQSDVFKRFHVQFNQTASNVNVVGVQEELGGPELGSNKYSCGML